MTTLAVGPNPQKHRDESSGGTVSAPRIFSTDLGSAPLPSRGLFYSVLVHVFFLVATLFVPWSYWFPPEPHIYSARSIEAHEVLLLPNLEPMASDNAKAPKSSNRKRDKAPRDESPAPSSEAKAIHGMVYQGPQVIISNPPHPDNFVQTIRRPDIAALKLPAPLALPPMVSIASASPVFVPPAPQVVPENRPVEKVAVQPITLPQQQPKVEVPKLAIPAAAPADALRNVVNATATSPMPTLAHRALIVTSGNAARNILIVNAIPAPDMKFSALPPGELNGAFAVSPAGTATNVVAGGGTTTVGAPGMGNGSNSAEAKNKAGSGTGDGKTARADVGPHSGAGNGSAGGGNSSGAGGHGRGSGSEAGAGSGTGHGTNPFPSITIQGGSGVSVRGRPQQPATAKAQASYGITFMASGSSGGGFKDYGVFRDETSYTVYVDMADTGINGANWTLQYALDTHSAPKPSDDPPPLAHGLLAPPYAKLKSLPHFSSEAARRSRGGMIVVFGVISAEGKFEDLRIIQSLDAGLDQLLLASLRKWTFQPAEIDGAQVAVKILLGVPVNSVPIE